MLTLIYKHRFPVQDLHFNFTSKLVAEAAIDTDLIRIGESLDHFHHLVWPKRGFWCYSSHSLVFLLLKSYVWGVVPRWPPVV